MDENQESLQKQNEKLSLRLDVLRSVLEFSPDAIILLDTQGYIREFNPSALSIVGYKPDDTLLGINSLNFIKHSDRFKAKTDFKYALENDELLGCEYQIISFDQLDKTVECSYRKMIQKEDEIFLIAILRNITKRKIDEKALINAKEKAEIADKLKTSFLANMSHEIRTPINAIMGFSDLLNDDYCTAEEKVEFVEIINANGQILLNLINDIIDVAKIESGQLKISESSISLRDLFSDLFETFSDKVRRSDHSDIELKFELQEYFKNKVFVTDPFRLNQILANLIGNALKFTTKGSITFGAELYGENFIRFYVKDTGIGMKAEEVKIIFNRFMQLEDSYKLNGDGTGLGLTISKSLVDLMGGKIYAESEIGVGSQFYFTLPLKETLGKSNYQPNNLDQTMLDLRGKRILVVEDSETNYFLIEVMLKKVNAEIIWALNGLQAVNICLNQDNIDLILMDINLPIMDGYEATGKIKEARPKLPIIAQTAYAMAGEREKSLIFGCDDYISKPINAELLYKLLFKYLG